MEEADGEEVGGFGVGLRELAHRTWLVPLSPMFPACSMFASYFIVLVHLTHTHCYSMLMLVLAWMGRVVRLHTGAVFSRSKSNYSP